MLARHFLNRTTESLGRPQLDFTPIALETMQQYVWPGNVRELANTIERAVLLGAWCRDRCERPTRNSSFEDYAQGILGVASRR